MKEAHPELSKGTRKKNSIEKRAPANKYFCFCINKLYSIARVCYLFERSKTRQVSFAYILHEHKGTKSDGEKNAGVITSFDVAVSLSVKAKVI